MARIKLINRSLIATIILFFSVSNLIESLPNFKFTFPAGEGFTFSFALILFNFVLLVYAVIQYFVIFGELLSRKLSKTTKQTAESETLNSEENDELTAFEKIDTTVEISKNDANFFAFSIIKMFAILIGVGLAFYALAMFSAFIINTVKSIN